mmetsp:Transcript_31915/g.67646  ORF Transcript_31915/g.67646 Transcript_31915/m.67646 type:complete len:428 (-) Transcript_31915:36-1319(-)
MTTTSKISAAFVHPSSHSPILFGITHPNTRQSSNLLQSLPSSLFPEDNKIDHFLPVIDEMNIAALNFPLENPKESTKSVGSIKFNEGKCVMYNGMSFSLASTLNVPSGQTEQRQNFNYPVEVIGHRGSLYSALENTSKSFIDAAKAGADGVELDVFLLKCGTLVVFHGSGGDEEPGLLHQYCKVEGSILDYTAAEARNLLTFNKNYAEFGCGPDKITHPGDQDHYCYVETLEEVLKNLRDHPEVPSNFSIKIELKGPGTALPAVQLVQKLNMTHRCHYSSFEHSRIAEVREHDPSVITGALFADDIPNDFVERSIAAGATEIHLKYDTCTSDRIQRIHAAGLRSMAWLRGPIGMKDAVTSKYFDVGNEDETMYDVLLRSGVQSICGNRPEVIVKVVESQGRRINWTAGSSFDEEKKSEDWTLIALKT